MIRLIIPGRPTVSLKNDRMKIVKKDGSESFPPSATVTKYMNIARNHIVQQLPVDFEMINGSIGVIAILYIKYDSQFPKSDVSNSFETLQECLQNTVIYDDHQVEGFFPYRKRVSSKEAEHAELYIFVVNNILEDMIDAINYIKEKENEYGDIETNGGNESRIDRMVEEIKVRDSF